MTAEEVKYKLEQYLSDTLPEQEFPAFWNSLQEANVAGVWQQAIEQVLENRALHGLADDAEKKEALEKLQEYIHAPIPAPHIRSLKTGWFRYAAVLLLIAGASVLMYEQIYRRGIKTGPQPSVAGILPGGNKAILTLADGSAIVLDSAANGNVAQQGGTKIIKLNAGTLAYDASASGTDIGYNILRTPNGGQYQITLPDGSKVWLNSASSVRFPTSFAGKQRKIEITGEAYLEIAANAIQSFTVEVNSTEIQVLGTSFNVNSYPEESEIKSTLIQGSIKVTRGSQSVLLKEGQQARVTTDAASLINVQTADIARVTAWKNGYFNFNGADIKSVMREIGRWYDLEIVFEAAPANTEIAGEIGRKLDLSQVMDMLKNLNVNCRLEGRKLIIK